MRNQALAEAVESILIELQYVRQEVRNDVTQMLARIAAESVLVALEAIETEDGLLVSE